MSWGSSSGCRRLVRQLNAQFQSDWSMAADTPGVNRESVQRMAKSIGSRPAPSATADRARPDEPLPLRVQPVPVSFSWAGRGMRNRRLASRGLRRRAIRLSLEVLEDRTTPSTFLVTNALDPGERSSADRCAGRSPRPISPGTRVHRRDHSGRAKRDHPPCRGDSDPLEPDDRERVRTPVDDSTAIRRTRGSSISSTTRERPR